MDTAKVGDQICILSIDMQNEVFRVGDTGTLTYQDSDGGWWADMDGGGNWCVNQKSSGDTCELIGA